MQEQTAEKTEKKLDIDEDKANPAFIPRQGYFYEHDMRIGDENDNNKQNEYACLMVSQDLLSSTKWFLSLL